MVFWEWDFLHSTSCLGGTKQHGPSKLGAEYIACEYCSVRLQKQLRGIVIEYLLTRIELLIPISDAAQTAECMSPSQPSAYRIPKRGLPLLYPFISFLLLFAKEPVYLFRY